MVVAIVGSRDFPSQQLVQRWIAEHLPPGITIISGAARGVDTWAIQAARAQGFATKEFPAQWEKYGKRAGFMRNTELAESADWVVAFWDRRSKGTRDTIIKAHEMNKVVTVVYPDGKQKRNLDNDEFERRLRDILLGDPNVGGAIAGVD